MDCKTIINQIIRASEKASKNQLQHLLVFLTPDGRLQLNGATNFGNGVGGHGELLPLLQTVLKDNVMATGEVVTPVC